MPETNKRLSKYLAEASPGLILAPMQDVTDRAFWQLAHNYGGPDIYFSEYFRVHADSHLEPHIVDALVHKPAGKPVIAQMIGNHIPALIRTAQQLQKFDIIGIDLNLGCPAPVVYKKKAGGGLLRDLNLVDQILGELRAAISINFTVKTRLGFDDDRDFERLCEIFARHQLDGLTVHGRTVREGYLSEVHYDKIRTAVESVSCPVMANGNIHTVKRACEVWDKTGAAGLMIGRGAIRNPWLFSQIKQAFLGEPIPSLTKRDLRNYIEKLYQAVRVPQMPEGKHVSKMKKYLNFIAQGVDEEGQFLFQIQRAETSLEFFRICDHFLDRDEPWLSELSKGHLDYLGAPRGRSTVKICG